MVPVWHRRQDTAVPSGADTTSGPPPRAARHCHQLGQRGGIPHRVPCPRTAPGSPPPQTPSRDRDSDVALRTGGGGASPPCDASLLVQTADASLQGEYAELVLHLPITDPLSDHIALVLQAAVEAEGEAGQLYAEALAEALAVHFLRRYTAAQPARCEVSGGLAPYKLRRVLAYIQTHLEEKLSLEQLATVAQLSPAHFARLFKHATGWAPHQYASRCRIEHAKRLLAETDMSLIDISAQVGCTDPSHFAALFRRHVAMAPNAYRRTMGGPLPHSCTT